MKIFQKLQEAIQSVWQAVVRIFQPSEDDYPETGVQPFEGEPYDEKEQSLS